MNKILIALCFFALAVWIFSAQAPAPVQFTCTAAGQSFSSVSVPRFQVTRGTNEYALGMGDDMLFYVRTLANGEKSWSSALLPGSHQMIDDVKPGDAITLIVSLGADIPKLPRELLLVTVAVKGVTKSALAKLPLILPVKNTLEAQGAHAHVTARYAGGIYEGASGKVVIEAVDFKAWVIRGRFTAEAKSSGYGAAPAGPTLKIEAGVFNLVERK
jgi:hypothetical protein